MKATSCDWDTREIGTSYRLNGETRATTRARKKKKPDKREFERTNEKKTTEITSPARSDLKHFPIQWCSAVIKDEQRCQTLPKKLRININKTSAKIPSAGFAPCPAARTDTVGVKPPQGISLRGVQFCKVGTLKVIRIPSHSHKRFFRASLLNCSFLSWYFQTKAVTLWHHTHTQTHIWWVIKHETGWKETNPPPQSSFISSSCTLNTLTLSICQN